MRASKTNIRIREESADMSAELFDLLHPEAAVFSVNVLVPMVHQEVVLERPGKENVAANIP